MLFEATNVRLLGSFHWKDPEFHAEEELKARCRLLGRPPRVCLVDSSVHTGASLFLSYQMVTERLQASVTRVVALVNNDLMPKGRTDPMKTQFLADNRFQYLFRVSQLEQCWKGRRPDYIASR